jgi:diguanylate cyclase (GGDEF)-like protein
LAVSESVDWYNSMNIPAGHFDLPTWLMKFLPEEPPRTHTGRPQWRSLAKAVRLLTQPPTSLPVLDRRRAYLLAWLLLVMILLTITGLILELIVDPPGSPRRGANVGLILLLLTLIGIAYALNRTGHYQLSAVLTILCAICGPWGSLVVDPIVVQGDFVPLTYVIISILLSSILLHPLFTSILAALQLIALVMVARFSPAAPINWPSLLALISFTSVLSILANLISQRDLEQIDRQTHKLAQSEAQQSALALSKTQLLEDAQKRIEQLTVLHEVAAVATQVSTVDQLIECTTTIIGENLFPDNFGVLLMLEGKGILRPHPSYQFAFDHHQLHDIPVGQGITGRVAQTGQPLRIGNIKAIQNYLDIDQRTVSELCVPIKFKDRVLGVINTESTRSEAFSPDDEFLLGTLAGQLATTIEQLRATAAEHRWLNQLAHSNELINALAHITTHMQKALTQDEIIQTMGNELNKIGLTCAMAVRNGDQGSFTIKYTSMPAETLERLEHNIGSPILGSTFSPENLKSTQEPDDFLKSAVIAEPDKQMQLFFPTWQKIVPSGNGPGMKVEAATTYLRLPLVFEESLLGVLWIWGRSLTEADLSVMSTFAQQVASALKRARLFQEVQSLALTDPLTGLQNRRSLFELGRIEFARSQRMDRPFCCLMLDLDHFKRINDNYGHPVGDLVVQEFAQCCKRSVREIDLIGRYGGEEVVIFLPETNLETALQVAERLRESVAKTSIRISDKELQFTVSIGVSRRDENTLELETLIARADQAMYVAKYKGRNRVAISK